MTDEAFFRRAKTSLSQEKAFVIYRKPGKPDQNEVKLQGFFQQSNRVHLTQDFKESGFVMAPFDLQQPTYLIPQNDAAYLHSFYDQKDLATTESKAETVKFPEAHATHLTLVKKGIKAIQDKELEKVVLSRKHRMVSTKNPFMIFRSLLKFYPTAYVYCWFHPKTGLWLGATPEILLRLDQTTLRTVALAGTKSALDSPEPQWTSKEVEEQQYVTQFIEEQLKNEVSELKTAPLTSIRAGNLWHLKNDISAKLRDINQLETVLKAIHPTPAVCGFPKEKAKMFILENEDYNRAFYAGFLGELNLNEKSELFVNLRCMNMEGQQCNLYVGGGIVKDSDPESEWQETINKAATITKAL